ncbi:SCO6880 family protein [Candidatus Blastococcus massiliensis]|uniref:SCO6880 family protein n=1 Tax=Candidatus Blastococcus massiliensis TaxID=1470358 RepID=UPI0004B1C2DA|nr:SCO6880 family protein [Candidatus Blastococcus massiliensis]
MNAVRYGDYSRDVSGWFLGMTGAQLALVTVTGVPALLALNAQAWALLVIWLPVWALLAAVLLVPIRGRAAGRWFADLCLHTIGGAMGWTIFGSRAASGTAENLSEADLPGVLAGIRTHDGPPYGHLFTRPVIVQNSAARTWAAVARIDHPGIGLAEPGERDRMGAGLAELCEIAARTELIDVLALQVRTVPDDGAERAAWERDHTRSDAAPLAVRVNALLGATLTPAAVRTEAFLTVVVGESRISRAAKESGGGVDGRARVLHGVMAEVESALRGPVGCTAVTWLDSATLAAAVRTGFAPGDRGQLIAADLAAANGAQLATGVPMAAAGPTQARAELRHYVHDAWASVTDTILLPDSGAVLGALAPVLVPTTAGERRCLTIFLAPLPLDRATRLVGREDMSATTGNELRARMGFRQRARQRRDTERIGAADEKLAAGRALVRPAVAACVTVPATWPVDEHGRRLAASVRAAGFVPLRLDLAQDSGFAAAAIPLGVGLPDRRGRR